MDEQDIDIFEQILPRKSAIWKWKQENRKYNETPKLLVQYITHVPMTASWSQGILQPTFNMTLCLMQDLKLQKFMVKILVLEYNQN